MSARDYALCSVCPQLFFQHPDGVFEKILAVNVTLQSDSWYKPIKPVYLPCLSDKRRERVRIAFQPQVPVPASFPMRCVRYARAPLDIANPAFQKADVIPSN